MGPSRCIFLGLGDLFGPGEDLGLHPLCTHTGQSWQGIWINLTPPLSAAPQRNVLHPQCLLGPKEVPHTPGLLLGPWGSTPKHRLGSKLPLRPLLPASDV